MQPITKKDLLDLMNAELKKHPNHDGEISACDVKQEGHVFHFSIGDIGTDHKKFFLANELISEIGPKFKDKFFLID